MIKGGETQFLIHDEQQSVIDCDHAPFPGGSTTNHLFIGRY